MYDMYVDDCKTKQVKPAKQHMYRQTFHSEFNIGFQEPKKDLCSKCEAYKNGSVSEEDYISHQARKEKARREKEQDKESAKREIDTHSCCFDMEQVLPCPFTNVSTMFYKRQLNCYNLTVYSLGDSEVVCYLWNETQGKRGTSEVGTSLVHYLKSLPTTVQHVILYSDCCGGQNRNRHICTAFLYALQECPNIKTIDHKFLTTGHTHMEVDSVHGQIEKQKKKVNVYIPRDYNNIIRLARRKKPYVVIPLTHNAFLDFKGICSFNPKVSSKGIKVRWLHICWFRYEQGSDVIKFKYEMDEDFEEVFLKSQKSTRAAASTSQDEQMMNPLQLYPNELPISVAKKEDLMSLFRTGVIPQEYKEFYQNLSVITAQEESDEVDKEDWRLIDLFNVSEQNSELMDHKKKMKHKTVQYVNIDLLNEIKKNTMFEILKPLKIIAYN